ncbi:MULTISPECIES: MBL fold metallo-hydrolase [unclassified Streptomyces]|uniref:MBL fold metallo-hydrolase n=1 Tax=unclassified Streptomyces TaxID=2593676 RepID=UPI0007C4FA88|nr:MULTISPECIES: MBL fold metallo-hydrolase [unclassified Streptomyces]MYT27593.1 MBL fold metallo-hydrolase [Streptomyces sp. SID8354]
MTSTRDARSAQPAVEVRPNTGPWYQLHEVDDGVVRITEPHVAKLVKANLWWLRGTDRDIVVDAGLGVAALRREIPLLFERDPLVILTHAHLDHAGGAQEFRERAAHEAAAEVLAKGMPASLYGAELHAKLGIEAAREAVPDLLIDALPHAAYDPRTYQLGPMTVTHPLRDGDTIDVGGRTLTVRHLPGHTPGCIALHEQRTGALYSGDVVYNGHLIDDLPESDPSDYRRSLQHLADLDVSVVHPGHGRSFGPRRLRELTQCYLLGSEAIR